LLQSYEKKLEVATRHMNITHAEELNKVRSEAEARLTEARG
jgi:hypothetical protein